jgi:two-component system, NtrC family, response regulator PilR
MPPRAPATPRTECEDIRVLIVEDDPDLRSAIFLGLLLQGMTGDAAADGVEGLRFVLEKKYDVVISDVRLPRFSGIELARRIQERRAAPKVVLLTAHPTPEVLKDAAAAGVSRILSKPLGLKVLARVVHELVDEH